ncbi:MAG: ABC transporter ATP-binding protein [Bacillota bacterium]
MAEALLTLREVWAAYDSLVALKGISLEVHSGEIVALIGANGAGKTTTLSAVSGLVVPARGEIRFGGELIAGVPAEEIVRRGIAQVPEGRRVFTRMTVLENLLMGAYARNDAAAVRQDLDRVFDLFPRLHERRKQPAGTLSGGEQQMLAIGRALMAKPKLLLLDEPSMGLAPLLVEKVFETILRINADGVTVLVVEQNAGVALSVSHRAYVLETGEIVLSGPSDELRHDPLVEKAYLGI